MFTNAKNLNETLANRIPLMYKKDSILRPSWVHGRKHWVSIRKETSKIHYLNISRKKMIISIDTEKVVDNIKPPFKHKNSKLEKRIFLGWESIHEKPTA